MFRKADQILGITRKRPEKKSENLIMPLYKSMVCSNLEPQCLCLQKDAVELETGSDRATRTELWSIRNSMDIRKSMEAAK